MKSTWRIFLALLTPFMLSACGGDLAGLAESMLYPFSDVNKKFPVPEMAPAGYESLFLKTKDTDGSLLQVHGWLRQVPQTKDKRIYIHLHGNGENLQALYKFNFLEKMMEFEASYLVIDYPGLGRSTGRPTEYSLKAAAIAAVDWVHQTFPDHKIILWGRSLGAAVALQAVIERQDVVAGLILTSPWSTFLEMAREKTNLVDQVPSEWLAKNRYDSTAAASQVHIQTLIHHGNKDTLIPIYFGQKVAASFSFVDRVHFFELTGLGHNDIFSSQKLWDDINNFVK